MTKKNLATLDLSQLIKMYRDAAAQHRAASDVGDYKKANPQAKTIIALRAELDRRGEDARRTILVLLDDKDAGVRCSVAGYAIDFAPLEAVPVLKKIASSADGTAGLAAEVVLERYGIIEQPEDD